MVGDLTLTLRKIHRPKGREAELRYFELAAKNLAGETSRDAVIDGLYSSGRPSIYLQPYFDISFNYRPRFGSHQENPDLSKNNVDILVFQTLSKIVKPGGKIIVTVSAQARLPLINETFLQLTAGIPYEATYIGHLLYRCDCGAFFKSWLLREGGREGPPALQGEKALDDRYRIRGLTETATRLIRFLKRSKEKEDSDAAVERAISILREMRVDDDGLQRQIDAALSLSERSNRHL
jgi:hypothetical protein